MIAKAIDDTLVEQMGFGLGDVIEVALRHMDDVTNKLATVWPHDAGERDAPDPEDESLGARVDRIAGSPIVFSDAECEALGSDLLDLPAWIAACSSPTQAGKALRWLSLPADRIRPELGAQGSILGPVLGVETDDGVALVPAALCLSAVAAAAAILGSLAAEDPEINLRLTVLTRLRATALLAPLRDDHADDGDRSIPDRALAESVLILRDRRHLVYVEMVAALRADVLLKALAEARARARTFESSMIEDMPSLAGDAEVVRLIIYGGSYVLSSVSDRVVSIHLSELDSIIDDAIAGDELELVWHFLEDLSAGPQLARSGADILDAWRHWRHYGTFDPTQTPGVLILVDPRPDETRWRTSAEWEPIEAVLTAVGLGSRSTWARAALDAPGSAFLRDDSGLCLALSDPPLVLFPKGDPALTDIGIEFDLAMFVANGIRATVGEVPDVANHIRNVGRPVVGSLEISATRHVPDSDEGVGFFFSAHATEPIFRLVLGLDWVSLLTTDAGAAHDALGHVLARAFFTLTPAGDWVFEDDPSSQAFLSAWSDAPPIAILRRNPGIPARAAFSSKGIPRTIATRARAYRQLAEEVRSAGIEPGVYRGEAAIDLCTRALSNVTERALDAVIRGWSPDALRAVIAAMNLAHRERALEAGRLDLALTAPWAAEARALALMTEDARSTKPLELLAEWILAHPPAGTIQPDRHDLALAADIAEIVLSLGLVRSGAAGGLYEAQVTVLPHGLFHAAPASGDPGDQIDQRAYYEAMRAHPVRIGRATTLPNADQPHRHEGGEASFVSVVDVDVPPSARRIDAALRADIGTGIDALIAVLATAASLDADEDGLCRVGPDDLARSAAEWSGCPHTEIDAAIRHLCLTRDAILAEGLKYWETERREHRLMSRPLVHTNGRIIIAPDFVRVAQRVFGESFVDGRLPWPKATMSQSLLDVLAGHRNRQARALERAAGDVAQSMGLPHRRNLLPHEGASAGLSIPGEIDLLVADECRRLWVCEVKDLAHSVSPRSTRARVLDYTGRDDYIGKLAMKVSAVAAATNEARAILGIEPARWEVRGVFITRVVEPAAFLTPPRALFVVIDDFADLLVTPNVPLQGHFEIGQHARRDRR